MYLIIRLNLKVFPSLYSAVLLPKPNDQHLGQELDKKLCVLSQVWMFKNNM